MSGCAAGGTTTIFIIDETIIWHGYCIILFMKIDYRPDTKENRIEDLLLFKKHWSFPNQLYKKAMAAVNDGNAVSLTLNIEKEKVVGMKIIKSAT